MTTPVLIRIREAAQLLATSPRTIQRRIDAGELTAIGRGRGRRVVRASIERYVERAIDEHEGSHDKT